MEVRPVSDGGFLVSLNSITYVVYRQFRPTGLQIRVNGKEHVFETEYDPSILTAEVPGKCIFRPMGVTFLIIISYHVKI